MKNYIKPIIISAVIIISILVLIVAVLTIYNNFKPEPEPEPKVEVQMDLKSMYSNASEEKMILLLDEKLIGNQYGKLVNDIMYIPVSVVTENINTNFFFDEEEKTLTYTTNDDIIRMKTDELTYFVNDEPIKLDIGMTTFDDGVSYLPVELIQKFSHHNFFLNKEYHTIRITDWYSNIKTGIIYAEEKAYIRQARSEDSKYIYEAYNGMEVVITGEDSTYYEITTREGFIGFILKENVREITTIHTKEKPVSLDGSHPARKFDGKLALGWHQVYSTRANQNIQNLVSIANGLDVISPTWFRLKGTDGNVSSLADINYVRWAHDQGYQVWALFSNLGPGYKRSMSHEVLSSTKKRTEVIKQLLAYADLYELDGINIDIENLSSDTGVYYVQFVKELAIYGKQQGLIMSVDVPVPRPWSAFYNRGEIAKYVDYIMVMSYDEHWSTSPESGSVASYNFVEDSVVQMLHEVPYGKLVLGVPFYTRLWKEEMVDGKLKVTNETYRMNSGLKHLQENNANIVWDDEVKQYYGEYNVGDIVYKMWREDERSIREKLNIANQYNLPGVAAWSFAFENAETWDVINEYKQGK